MKSRVIQMTQPLKIKSLMIKDNKNLMLINHHNQLRKIEKIIKKSQRDKTDSQELKLLIQKNT